MPQSGDVVVSGVEAQGPWSLFVFSLNDGPFRNIEMINSSCSHYGTAKILSLAIDRREKIVVTCMRCNDVRLFDQQTGKWWGAYGSANFCALSPGRNSRIFVQLRINSQIDLLQLDSSGLVFKKIKTVTDVEETLRGKWAKAMCYVPPLDYLVICFGDKLVARSVDTKKVIWEIPGRCEDIIFHPEHNVLLANKIKETVLIVNPSNGLTETIDLPDLGNIRALGLRNDQIKDNNKDTWKISYLNLSYSI